MQPCKRHLTAILLPSAAFTDAPLSSHRENLSKDLYLISQMDSDQFVPIWTIASMEGIKVLTTDTDLILDVLRCTCLHFTSMVHFFFYSKYKNVYCSECLQHLQWSKLMKKGKRCVQITRDASSFCEKSLKLHLLRWEILSRSRSCGYLRDPLLFMCVRVCCSHQEVEALFKNDNCPKVISVEFAHNNNWYITFQSDTDAQQVWICFYLEIKQIAYLWIWY